MSSASLDYTCILWWIMSSFSFLNKMLVFPVDPMFTKMGFNNAFFFCFLNQIAWFAVIIVHLENIHSADQ